MAEIILPPEENEETPQVPELNIDKPTENSKVITIEFEAKKTNKVSTKDTNQQLYTTDTDAWFEFKETSLEGANGTYSVVFRNRHDGSIFQRTGGVVNGVAYYKIPHQEIRHAGAWRGQIVYTLSNGDTTSREFGYDVKGHILDGKDVREIVVEDFETLMSQLRSMKDNAEVELADLVNTANQNETDRQVFFDNLIEDIDELQANYQELLDTGVLQTNINNKLEQLEEEYAPKLTEVTAQLAQTTNKFIGYKYLSNSIYKMMNGLHVKGANSGDSIMFGLASSAQSPDNISVHLQSRLRDIYDNENITVVNKAVSGYNTKVYYNTRMGGLLEENPDFATVAFGINDMRGSTSAGDPLSVEDYKHYLNLIVEELVKNGIEVLVMSPTPILDQTSNYYKKIEVFVKASYEVANSNNVAFFDLNAEINNLFYTGQEVAKNGLDGLYTDGVHWNSEKYKYLGEMVAGRVFNPGLIVESEFEFPAVRSRYVKSDATYFNISTQKHIQNYTMKSDGSAGTHIEAEFYMATRGLDLYIVSPKQKNGGIVNIKLNGEIVATIDFSNFDGTIVEDESLVLKDVPIGNYKLEILPSDISVGNSSANYGEVYITSFKFKQTKSNETEVFWRFNDPKGVAENFKKVTDGLFRYNNPNTSRNGVIFTEIDPIMKQQGKKLVIEAKGIFSNLSGLSWYWNKGSNVQGVAGGYQLLISDFTPTVRLNAIIAGNTYANSTNLLASSEIAVDMNVEHTVRIEHSYDGRIKVIIDEIEHFTLTDGKFSNGYFGYGAYTSGESELSRYEYCLVEE